MVLLDVADLHVKYGNIEVLHGINLGVNEGEIVTILGANGAGKSTTLLTLSGLIRTTGGSIAFNGLPIHKLPAHSIVRLGIAQVPEGRRIFNTLTVQENLNLGAFVSKNSERVRKTQGWIYGLLPILAERRHQLGGTLSGGEQQMLAIGRALMSEPKILLLDEPSLGLAPLLVRTIFQTLKEINTTGVTMVLVEQNARAALKLAHRGYVMELGNIVLEGPSAELMANPEVQAAYLGTGGS
jgi:branched-chain amino acid transport system ATP-binding protein